MEKKTDGSNDQNDEYFKGVTEDDILHEQILEDFSGNLSQEEAEILYTYLTTPYMRIPLVLQFFGKDRVGTLFDSRLQKLFEECLFSPGIWGNDLSTAAIDVVPCKPSKLNTYNGCYY